jgi:5-methylcytosine-specific restriction endonuclease McrA
MTTVLRTCRCGAITTNPPCPTCRRSGASRPELNRYAWQKTRRQVRQRDGNQCTNCGSIRNLSVHHLVPSKLGGTDHSSNLVTLCANCHRGLDAKNLNPIF